MCYVLMCISSVILNATCRHIASTAVITNVIQFDKNMSTLDPKQIPGLRIQTNYISIDEEQKLLHLIEHQQNWNNELTRRTQHYGYQYVYKTRKLREAPPVPDWLKELGNKIQKTVNIIEPWNQIIINEYNPGQGIAAHIDHPQLFGPVIASLSLQSATTMDFACREFKTSIRLEPRTLLLLEDCARYNFTHCIKCRQSDLTDGKELQRGKRVSITFRTVKSNVA